MPVNYAKAYSYDLPQPQHQRMGTVRFCAAKHETRDVGLFA